MGTHAGQAIMVDARSGRIEGAAPHERMAAMLLRNAARLLQPVDNLGFSYLARATRTLLPSAKRMVFRLSSDSVMETDYCDAYWGCLLLPGYRYEGAVRTFVAAADDVPYGFIDGGANHGYWSILVTGAEAGAKKAVAVEAASDTFERLLVNRGLNGSRFQAVNRAIGARSGERVVIYGAKHEARSTKPFSADARPILDCETITVDELAEHDEFSGIDKFVVKLDVEGVEIESFEGASRLLAADTAFIYEDHGSDPGHATTRHVLEELELRVFWLGDGNRREIVCPEQVGPIKRSRRRGYDMVATRSRFWIERLERLSGSARGLH